jgi:hypothetical protein
MTRLENLLMAPDGPQRNAWRVLCRYPKVVRKFKHKLSVHGRERATSQGAVKHKLAKRTELKHKLSFRTCP